MSVSGLCQVCEAAEATRSCQNCGLLVCEKHFDGRVGICVECAKTGGRSL